MTDVYFCFDTEDYTSDKSSTSAKREADILYANGIKGNFNLVGYLARELIRNRRFDVIDSLKKHTISTHSLRHSYHPTICEYTDLEDYREARRECERQEAEGLGMIKAAMGIDSVVAACPPGFSMSYVAMYTYADWDIPIFIGSINPMPDGSGFYYCNGFHTNYDICLEDELYKEGYDEAELLDRMSALRHCFICHHPHRAIYKKHWDRVNYDGYNHHPMYEWEEPEMYAEEEIEMFYRRMDSLAKALKSDPRFVLPPMEALDEKVKKDIFGRTVTRDMLPSVRESLNKDFRWTESPVSLSLSDCFFAARHFLFSDEPYTTGRVRGFLSDPEGITESVTLHASEIRKAAENLSPDDFLPPFIFVDGQKVGPADFLFAMLDVAMGAESVTLSPRTQECSYAGTFPHIKACRIDGFWIHSSDFKDEWLSRRIRQQTWTLRTEL